MAPHTLPPCACAHMEAAKAYWKGLKLGQCFICVDRVSSLNDLHTRGCKLKCGHHMFKKIYASEKQQHRINVTQETTSVLGKTRDWPGSWGAAETGTCSARQLLLWTSLLLPTPPIFQEKLWWTTGNAASHKTVLRVALKDGVEMQMTWHHLGYLQHLVLNLEGQPELEEVGKVPRGQKICGCFWSHAKKNGLFITDAAINRVFQTQ